MHPGGRQRSLGATSVATIFEICFYPKSVWEGLEWFQEFLSDNIKLFCYHMITLLYYLNILLSHYSIIILTYSVITLLHYYYYYYYYKFGSTLATRAKIFQKNKVFSINTHYFLGDPVFCWEKSPCGRRQAQQKGLELSNHLPQPSGQAHGSDPKFPSEFDICLTFFGSVWEHLGCIQGVARGRQQQVL